MRILIIEDEKNLADALSQILTDEKYQVDVVFDGQSGLDYALATPYDGIILDVMLPKLSGFEVLKQLRQAKNSTPLLLLTARDETRSKIEGLDNGADDYMTKPFVPEELLARLRAIMRRKGDLIIETLVFGDLTLELDTYHLKSHSKAIRLGFKEFEVLRLLMSNCERIIEKETLITRVWGSDSEAVDNNVEAYISFLRKKFQFLGSSVKITAIRKVGYKLEAG